MLNWYISITREVSRPHTHDDDGHRLGAGCNNGCLGGLHVVDHAVGDDQQHGVLLMLLAVAAVVGTVVVVVEYRHHTVSM